MSEVEIFDVQDIKPDSLEKDPGRGGNAFDPANIESMSDVALDIRRIEYSLSGDAFDHRPDLPSLDRGSRDLFIREGFGIVDPVGRRSYRPVLELNKPIEIPDTKVPTLAFYLYASRHKLRSKVEDPILFIDRHRFGWSEFTVATSGVGTTVSAVLVDGCRVSEESVF